jgi:hypothetical protein
MNAATSEGLGAFYGDVLAKDAPDFLTALAQFPPARQKSLCYAAYAADGGRIGLKAVGRIRGILNRIGGNLALVCMRQVRLGNLEAEKANENASPQPPKKD